MVNKLLKSAIKINSCLKEKENQQLNPSVLSCKNTIGINFYVLIYFLPNIRAHIPYFHVKTVFQKTITLPGTNETLPCQQTVSWQWSVHTNRRENTTVKCR